MELPLIEVDECNWLYQANSSSESSEIPEGYKLVQPDMVCAGYADGGKDSCHVRGTAGVGSEGHYYGTGLRVWSEGHHCGGSVGWE